MSASGRVPLPVEVGRLLGLEGETEVEVGVGGVSMILRPTVVGGAARMRGPTRRSPLRSSPGPTWTPGRDEFCS